MSCTFSKIKANVHDILDSESFTSLYFERREFFNADWLNYRRSDALILYI